VTISSPLWSAWSGHWLKQLCNSDCIFREDVLKLSNTPDR